MALTLSPEPRWGARDVQSIALARKEVGLAFKNDKQQLRPISMGAPWVARLTVRISWNLLESPGISWNLLESLLSIRTAAC